ncbi:MAG TPA: glucosidase [Acidobacteriota bacterium]|nr:glucosidase [Acidobacteriota bacterium]
MREEEKRLEEAASHKAHWRRWGPYLSERQWGTVREDYSPGGTPWEYFPYDHARSRAYRWGEDGLLGISDNHQRLCFAFAVWNGRDPMLKERLFGLSNNQGNHGEDVKECYYYLDNTPTHSYMRALYRYPQAEYPYQQLLDENRRRGRQDPEYELIDTGIFDENRYFDVFVEYAKAGINDILIRLEAINAGPDPAVLHLLPVLWFRNTWSWFKDGQMPGLELVSQPGSSPAIRAQHQTLGSMWLTAEEPAEELFTENETNVEPLFAAKNRQPYVKDGINGYVVHNQAAGVNPAKRGTKAALHYQRVLASGESWGLHLRLNDAPPQDDSFGHSYRTVFSLRKREADEFYERITCPSISPDDRKIQRQAFAGMLWSKQFYHYVVPDWLAGDSVGPPPPPTRQRNRGWEHVYTDDILSIPDKWEFPWFASWDQAFHCIPLAMIDPDYAKRQLILLTREWYMHPNGQIPAYEWAFGDANPPVHAWAAWRVYKIEKKIYGRTDRMFLERVFQKLLLNFTWWVNREDTDGSNIFEGGFLGLDNIGVFDRSKELPAGGHLQQSDATSWMAMYCLNMLTIAIELAQENRSYSDIASKFLEHFLRIAQAMNRMGEKESLWNEEDGFFYDRLRLTDGTAAPLRVRSAVGLIPLFAVETLELSDILSLPDFSRRMKWFLDHRPEMASNVLGGGIGGVCERRILSIVTPGQLKRILERMLSREEFLSEHGIRALSRYHQDNPYTLSFDGHSNIVDYEPAESCIDQFGGNSNWRGPIWMPINYLMIESLQKFHHYLGSEFKVECPTGSGQFMTLWEVAAELSRRIIGIFQEDEHGRRPLYNGVARIQDSPRWNKNILYYEYFHGESGAGLGASHQTGWTGLVAKLIQQLAVYCDSIPE